MNSKLSRMWRTLTSRLGTPHDSSADLAAQLRQLIVEAREQHRLLTEQAANVIANQTRLAVRLERAIEARTKATSAAREALMLADQRTRAGDVDGAAALQRTAESSATRLIALDQDVEELRSALLEATGASDAAKDAVARSAAMLNTRLAGRERVLSRLDQARLQEQLNAARAQLDRRIGEDVPNLAQVSRDIDRRLATAQALEELRTAPIDEERIRFDRGIEQAEARGRLDRMRGQLGLTASTPEPAADAQERTDP